MATEDDPVVVQSTVQYKKFDNEDGPENDKGSDVTSGSGAASSTTSDTTDIRPPGGMSQPAVEANVGDNSRAAYGNGGAATRHEVVLQMNGRPTNGVGDETMTGEEEEWNWINLILSVCSIFCCTVCGILATVTSILAYIDHRVRDFDAARRKRDAAYALALTALISGVVVMILVVVLSVVFL